MLTQVQSLPLFWQCIVILLIGVFWRTLQTWRWRNCSFESLNVTYFVLLHVAFSAHWDTAVCTKQWCTLHCYTYFTTGNCCEHFTITYFTNKESNWGRQEEPARDGCLLDHSTVNEQIRNQACCEDCRADPSWCNSACRQNPLIQQNCHNFWTNTVI